ncbi:hypothetical protein HW555_007895 [Spodoptera exigua]|uniref:Uncharacterized protein n=1 Tax=Spodoptera exigua TaxID=7107 RepID=A0A835L405_SPOEX|nr:hypothetical protein HW555_007895 [Spodoptera exigua]
MNAKMRLFYYNVSMRAAAARQHSVRHVIHLRGARTFLSNVLFPGFAAISGIIPVSATCVGIPLFSGTETLLHIDYIISCCLRQRKFSVYDMVNENTKKSGAACQGHGLTLPRILRLVVTFALCIHFYTRREFEPQLDRDECVQNLNKKRMFVPLISSVVLNVFGKKISIGDRRSVSIRLGVPIITVKDLVAYLDGIFGGYPSHLAQRDRNTTLDPKANDVHSEVWFYLHMSKVLDVVVLSMSSIESMACSLSISSSNFFVVNKFSDTWLLGDRFGRVRSVLKFSKALRSTSSWLETLMMLVSIRDRSSPMESHLGSPGVPTVLRLVFSCSLVIRSFAALTSSFTSFIPLNASRVSWPSHSLIPFASFLVSERSVRMRESSAFSAITSRLCALSTRTSSCACRERSLSRLYLWRALESASDSTVSYRPYRHSYVAVLHSRFMLPAASSASLPFWRRLFASLVAKSISTPVPLLGVLYSIDFRSGRSI